MATANLFESKKGFQEGSLVRESFNSTNSDFGSEAPKNQYKDCNSEAFRVSLSSVISSSSHGSGQDDVDALGDVYLWGEGLGEGLLGGGTYKTENGSGRKMDSLLPKHLESAVVLDVHNIACGRSHCALVNRQGEVFCWGEESGGRLGHGVLVDVAHPQLVESLASTCVEQVACGEYHTCAVTRIGDLYTWGDGTRSFGLLGQGNDFCHWMPKRVQMPEGVKVSTVACGPWHTALITSSGQLFTFGDGTFGTLGHGDNLSVSIPKEIESLKGLRTVKVACGAWHTAAVIEVIMGYSDTNVCPSGKLFTWGDAEKGRLGHGDKGQKNVPTCVAALVDYDFRQVACGHSLTVALTTSGTVFTMGSTVYGQLGDPQATGKCPFPVKGNLWEEFVEDIACGSHHVAALTSKMEVYTWGKGANGRLGHGDIHDRHTPTLVEALKEKQVKSIACGPSFTAAVCLHKWLSGADQSICSGCRLSFGFTRKRHNCYNCGHVFCHACSSKKAARAILAPTPKKPYRVCDSCYIKLKSETNGSSSLHIGGLKRSSVIQQSLESRDGSKRDPKQPSAQLSLHPRLYDVDQLRQYEEKLSFKFSRKPESLRRVSPAPSLFYETDSSLSYKYPISPISAPRRTISTVTSPMPRRSIPPRSAASTPTFSGLGSPDFIFDELKKTNKSLTQEVLKLRAQVNFASRK
jgi:alpha-tubulin suppressor-like RCC1 family protein